MTKLQRKYNAVCNFLKANKSVALERGCLYDKIVAVEYDADMDVITFRLDTTNDLPFMHVYGSEFDDKAVNIHIDRKYKLICLYGA